MKNEKYLVVDQIVKFGEGWSCTGCVFDGGMEKGCLILGVNGFPDCCTDGLKIIILNPEYKENPENNT